MLVTHALNVILYLQRKDKENANYWPSDSKLLAIRLQLLLEINIYSNFNYKEIITRTVWNIS